MAGRESIGGRHNGASRAVPERELVVIARPQAELRARPDGSVASESGADVDLLQTLHRERDVAFRPLFGLSEQRIHERQSSAAAMARDLDAQVSVPDLARYYRVEAPDDQLNELAESLVQLETVEAAYVKPPPEPAVAVLEEEDKVLNAMAPTTEEAPPASPDFRARQNYLYAAPGGIAADYAWTIPGGRGANVGIVDIEGAWRFSHEDLVQNQGGVIGGTPTGDLGWRNHGTAVVGEFGGDRNSFGIEGICPDAHVRAVSIFGGVGSAQAIRMAADASQPGDIILIELHAPGPEATGVGQQGYVAMEWWPDNFAAIRYAVARGVIVVEAAGNGGVNYDDAIYDQRPNGFPTSWRNPFNPSNPSSGAVLVGAGAPPPGTHGRDHGPDRSRLSFSNYGARLDVQGWGREVTTAGYGDLQGGSNEDLWYTDQFSGTSSASPIVVGALGCVQGILKNQGLTPLTSEQARQLLRTTGSPQQDAPGRPASQRIGNRPNLQQMVASAAQVWHYNKVVHMTYASYHSQNAWAYIEDVGWRKIKPGAPDGVTNLFMMFCLARGYDRRVHVLVDGQFIYQVYLV